MQKPETTLCRSLPLWAISHFGQGRPITPHRFEQAEGADDVGLNELARAMDGAVHMAFCGEVDHRARLVLGQQAADQGGIADVALHQLMTSIALQAGQSLGVTRVGELVEVDDGLIAGGQPVEHEVGANKTCAAGHKNCHFLTLKLNELRPQFMLDFINSITYTLSKRLCKASRTRETKKISRDRQAYR